MLGKLLVVCVTAFQAEGDRQTCERGIPINPGWWTIEVSRGHWGPIKGRPTPGRLLRDCGVWAQS